jgi:hypothetical protein
MLFSWLVAIAHVHVSYIRHVEVFLFKPHGWAPVRNAEKPSQEEVDQKPSPIFTMSIKKCYRLQIPLQCILLHDHSTKGQSCWLYCPTGHISKLLISWNQLYYQLQLCCDPQVCLVWWPPYYRQGNPLLILNSTWNWTFRNVLVSKD